MASVRFHLHAEMPVHIAAIRATVSGIAEFLVGLAIDRIHGVQNVPPRGAADVALGIVEV